MERFVPASTAPSPCAAGVVGSASFAVGLARDLDGLNASSVSAEHSEAEAAEVEILAAARQPAELVHDRPADGVVLLVAQVRREVLVEVLDPRQAEHVIAPVALVLDRLGLLRVVLVVDIADDLLEDMLDRRKPRHA